MIEFARYLYDLFGLAPRAELSTRPDNRLGTDEQWDRAEGALEQALKRHEMEYVDQPGRGHLLRPEDRPPHDRRARARAGRWGRSSSTTRCRCASGSRTWAPTTAEHHPVVIHRALLGLARALHRDPRSSTTAARSRSGSRRCRSGSSRSARATARRGARARREAPAADFRVDVDERDETVGKRIRDAEVEKIPYVIVYGDRESDASPSPSASAAASSRRRAWTNFVRGTDLLTL